MWLQRVLRVLAGLIGLALLFHTHTAVATTGAGTEFAEEEVTVDGAGVQLPGTILLPAGEDPVFGMVLVHGAGPHTQGSVRAHAEAFAELGVATLIYDKRQAGYSEFERYYELLAEDAVAAVETLSAHPRVDADAIGIWGLSEGAWVAPLAAASSSDIGFIVTVGASGVSPLQQTSWALDNTLADRDVTGLFGDMVTTTGLRVLRGIEVFPEADFDPVPAWKQVDVPVLALWGAHDQTAPPTESAHIMAQAIDPSSQLSLRLLPDAGHDLNIDHPDEAPRSELTPEYPALVVNWVDEVVNTAEPAQARDDFPAQHRTSTPLAPLAWWESEWVHLVVLIVLGAGFLTYLIARLVTWLRRRRQPQAEGTENTGGFVAIANSRMHHGVPLTLAVSGLVVLVGFFGYYGTVMFSNAMMLGPVIGTRPVIWLLLQALAVLTVVLVVVVAVRTVKQRRSPDTRSTSVPVVLLLITGMVFIPWAFYWGLLLP